MFFDSSSPPRLLSRGFVFKRGANGKLRFYIPDAKPGTGLHEITLEQAFEWLPKTKEVHVKKGNDLIVLKINFRTAKVNGKSVQLLQPAQIVNGRTMIPLRFISENLGYYVQYVLVFPEGVS